MSINGDKAIQLLSWEACPETRDFDQCEGFWLNHIIPDFCVKCWRYYFSCIAVNRDYKLDERRLHGRIRLR
jgi:hypothetical protein